MNPPAVQTIRGYELYERIGAGGFGVVYRAHQPSVEREVAIKVILPEYANHPDFIRRFETEAQLVARLEHLHIVPLYDYWREPDGAYLVMRYLRGGDLSDSLQQGPWTPQAATRLLDQVASALTVAHRQGVVHRDIKPRNILLDEESNAYLSDFGIAKELMRPAGVTGSGEMLGSPAYISPEQAKSEALTARSDLYSLGVVMYQVLTGEHPFPGVTPVEQLMKHLTEPLPPLRERRPDLPEALEQVIQRATAKDPEARFPDALAFAAALGQALSGAVVEVIAPPPDLVPLEMINPYKGLRAFEEADADDFFGREALIEQLLARLGEDGGPSEDSGQGADRFLAVVGPSGSGKSSVVRAGLIPALRQGALPGSEDWLIVEMFPGAHPLEELEAALLRVAVNPPPSLIEQLRDEHGLLRAIKRTLPAGEFDLLLVIDQFEELFTLVDDEGARRHFMRSLLTAVTDPRSRLRVVVTLRADFYDRPLQYVAFGELLRSRMETVLPLSNAELERAICDPVERVGANLEAGLVAAIVAEVGEQPGALPMLQYALTELFERREGRLLTREAYRAIGGVSGALARRAEEVYTGLDEAGQAAARQMFLRLVTLGEGVEDTRRRVLRGELTAIEGAPGAMDAAIEAFGRSRLLLFDRDPATRAPTMEVAHEALLREWLRLRGWLDESRADVRTQRLLATAAADWIEAEHDPSFLLRGTRLDQFELWSITTDLALTQAEREYLDASLAEREARREEEAERKAREAALERQSRNFLRGLVAVLGIATVVALVLTMFAFSQRRDALQNEALAARHAATATIAQGQALSEAATAVAAQEEAQFQAGQAATAAAVANEQRALAEGQKNVAERKAREALEAYSLSLAANARVALNIKDTATGLVLALIANQIDDPPEQSRHTLADAAFAPNPRRRFQVTDIFPDVTGVPLSVDISPDGRTALTGLSDGTIILWDVSAALNTGLETGAEIHRFRGHTSCVNGVTFSPDGKTALSGSNDGMLVLWDVVTGQEVRRFGKVSGGYSEAVLAVDISPDGRTAVSGGISIYSGGLILWDLETGTDIRRFEEESHVRSVAFSPDGRTVLVSIGSDLILWDVETGEELRRFGEFGMVYLDVAISPDGDTGLTASSDYTVDLWDLETGELLRTFAGHVESVFRVAFTPDGRRALSGSGAWGDSGTLILWDLESGEQIMSSRVHAAGITDIAITPDGRTALSGSLDNALILWDLVSAGEIGRFEGHRLPEGIVILRDLETGEIIRRFTGHTTLGIWGAAVGPDGRTEVTIWDSSMAAPPLDELLDWINANRYVRELTCDEREAYRIEPLCQIPVPTVAPAAAPRLPGTAHPGENRGEIILSSFDVWQYEGQAGETLTIRLNADRPANHADPSMRLKFDLLDTVLAVIAPDGSTLAENDDIIDGIITNSLIKDLVLPVHGTYQIEARSWEDRGWGTYTLVIESTLPEETPTPAP